MIKIKHDNGEIMIANPAIYFAFSTLLVVYGLTDRKSDV